MHGKCTKEDLKETHRIFQFLINMKMKDLAQRKNQLNIVCVFQIYGNIWDSMGDAFESYRCVPLLEGFVWMA